MLMHFEKDSVIEVDSKFESTGKKYALQNSITKKLKVFPWAFVKEVPCFCSLQNSNVELKDFFFFFG